MTPVVADADVLFGATTRGLLIHLDFIALIRLHWSPLILDELSRALVDTGRKPNDQAARRHEQLLRAALPHADVPVVAVQKQFQAVAAAVRSAKDIHVAACAHALAAGAAYPHARIDLWGRDAAGLAAAFAALRATLRSAPTPEQLLERLSADGQVRTATVLRDASRHGAVVL